MAKTGGTPGAISGKFPAKAETNEQKTRRNMQEDFGGEAPLYQVVQVGNEWQLTGTENAPYPGRVYLFINNKGDYEVLSAEAVREAYIKEAQASKGGVESLRQQLYRAGYMNEVQFSTKDPSALALAITDAASKVSANAVLNFRDSGLLISQSFDKYLNSLGTGTGTGPRSGAGQNLTSRTQTDQDIDEYFFDMLGRKATIEEKEAYYKKVNKEEKAAVVKQTTDAKGKTVTVGEYLNADDYARIKADIIKPAIKGTNLEDLGKSNGKVSQGVSELKEYATAYGIKLDTKQALDKIMGTFSPSGGADINIAKNGIKSMAKGFYSNLSNLIDEGVKVSDIANQYAYYKGQILELPDDAISIFDEDIQAALSNRDESGAQKAGVMTLTDYQKLLRTNPKTKELWLKTKGAREEASNYATSILRMFGLMA